MARTGGPFANIGGKAEGEGEFPAERAQQNVSILKDGPFSRKDFWKGDAGTGDRAVVNRAEAHGVGGIEGEGRENVRVSRNESGRTLKQGEFPGSAGKRPESRDSDVKGSRVRGSLSRNGPTTPPVSLPRVEFHGKAVHKIPPELDARRKQLLKHLRDLEDMPPVSMPYKHCLQPESRTHLLYSPVTHCCSSIFAYYHTLGNPDPRNLLCTF